MSEPDRMQSWENKWASDNIAFHMPTVNPHLEEWYHRLVKDDKPVTVLVPLCGKTLDMMWLYNKGHTVIGIEGVEKAIIEFFTENNLTFTKSATDSGNLFQTADGRIRLYQDDICQMSADLVGPVQAVWDRGSYVAVEYSDRAAYARFMRAVMAPDCQWLLWAVEFDKSRYSGPPHSLTESDIRQDLDLYVKVECLGRHQKTPETWKRLSDWNLERADMAIYLITPK